MNVHDSERMAGLLDQAGYEPTADDRDADVIVINTCSVRERAEEKLFTRLGEIRNSGRSRKARGRSWRSPAASRSRKASRILRRSSAVDVIIGLRTSGGSRCSWTMPSSGRTRPTGRRPRTDGRRVVPAGDRTPAGSGEGVRHHHRGLQRVLRLLRRAVHARATSACGRSPTSSRTRGKRRAPAPRSPAARTDRQSLSGAGRSGVRLRRHCSSG